MANKSNTLYVGSTKNIAQRVKQHKRSKSPHFTAKYNIDRLIYTQEFESLKEALAMEKKVKGWTRKKKVELIKSINPTFMDLSY